MAQSAQDAYDELIRRSREISVLASCGSVLGWDRETYMPKQGAEHRSEQLGLLSGLCHEKFTDPEIGDLLAAVEGTDLVAERLSDAAVNVRETRRVYDRATKLPNELVVELARTTSLAHGKWVEARQRKDFALFQPWLEKVVSLKQREADCYGHDGNRYDALLEDYEPGATCEWLEGIFAPLRDDLVDLLDQIQGASRRPDTSILERCYPVVEQEALGRQVAEALGFDFGAGRLDVVAHPFCSGIGPGDTRLTTRYDEHSFGDGFFSIVHETGHGLYDQGLPAEHWGTPRGESVSLGIHESQSRLWENFVARSRPFWTHFYPRAQQRFPEALGEVALDDFFFAVNDVRPSFIRVEADEATYNLHILLRFELERALLAGDLAPADVPDAWNQRFTEMFGITPPDDAQGCLQDVHWSGGGIGYFPTYTLGNLNAAQLFASAERAIGDLPDRVAAGDFAPLLEWLRENIHRRGMQYRAPELIEVVTGQPLSHQPLIAHLRAKFEPLYGL
jgi:carboxypeptidase Taq